MIVGAVLLAVFVRLESRVAHPLLPLRLVLDRTRGGSFLAVFVIGMGMFSIFLFLTYYLEASIGYSPIKTGLAFLPMVAGIVACVDHDALAAAAQGRPEDRDQRRLPGRRDPAWPC